jgi:5-methylcytosine-specific restriction endonuclease McrA
MVNVSSLVLNIAYQPIEIVSWQDAVILHFAKNAKILASYDDVFLHSPSLVMPAPAVILREDADFVSKAFTNVMPFNRENVFKRDNGSCMYCGKKVTFDEFTFDHVIPRDQGGKSVWTNIVISCFKCNSKKRNRTPKEARMNLIRLPFVPKLDRPVPRKLIKTLGMRIPHKTWVDYIYWKVVLQN